MNDQQKKPRKSKYDMFVIYDSVDDSVFTMIWDTSFDDLDQWVFRDGDSIVRVAETYKNIIDSIKKYGVILDRIPEQEWKSHE